MLELAEFNQKFFKFFHQNYGTQTELLRTAEYALTSPGKRLRPLLVFESSKLIELDLQQIEAFAFALEIIHIFSLIHDDLPCLDNDDFRRGLPTTHKKFGEAQALLAGDNLILIAFEIFSELATWAEPQHYQKAFRFFCKCIGNEGMIGGQSLELEIKFPSLQQLIHIQSLKTGALFKAALLVPLYLKGMEESDSHFLHLSEYAENLGFAFQIADDLEDEKQDAAMGNKNILSLMGKNKAIEFAMNKLQSSPLAKQFSTTEFLLNKITAFRS